MLGSVGCRMRRLLHREVRQPGAYASAHSEIVQAQRKARAVFVREIATIQFGAPVGLIAVAFALNFASDRPRVARGAWGAGCAAFVAAMIVSHIVGRVLWAIGVRPRR
jgi:hypothetical protein